ncbi:MAG: helix-turn-helix domain-containing protein [Aigarchaeota archaeon]|nr:helix-turn-helix domain-containing protein [Candidatus Pelearchaeum maunauluense]
MAGRVFEVNILLDLDSLPDPEKKCTALKLVKDGKGPLECLNPMSDVRHFIRLKDGQITIGTQSPDSCPFYKIYSSLHIHVVKCSVFHNHSLATIICTESALDGFYKRLEELGANYRLVSVRQLSTAAQRKQKMTANQMFALFTAHSLGYFESPSKASIRDVATVLDKSPSTVSELIKKGVKNLLDIIKERKDFKDLLNLAIFPRTSFLLVGCPKVNSHFNLILCAFYCAMTIPHMFGL